MAKKLIQWPDGPVDKIVQKWLDEHNIKDTQVNGYKIQREADGTCWIELRMWFDAAATEVPSAE